MSIKYTKIMATRIAHIVFRPYFKMDTLRTDVKQMKKNEMRTETTIPRAREHATMGYAFTPSLLRQPDVNALVLNAPTRAENSARSGTRTHADDSKSLLGKPSR